MRRLIRGLARLVHRRGAVLLAQNGEDVIGPSLGHLDGWNREDVSWSYDFARRRYFEVRAAETAGSPAGAAGFRGPRPARHDERLHGRRRCRRRG